MSKRLAPGSPIEAVWRIEQPKLAARSARLKRDVGMAEEIAQDAFVQAHERWAKDGIPDNPAALLTRVARNRALDRLLPPMLPADQRAVLALRLLGRTKPTSVVLRIDLDTFDMQPGVRIDW